MKRSCSRCLIHESFQQERFVELIGKVATAIVLYIAIVLSVDIVTVEYKSVYCSFSDLKSY